jgi:hypothetical protein
MRPPSRTARFLVVSLALGFGLPAAAGGRACDSPKDPIRVVLSKRDYPHIVAHIKESWDLGYPKVLKINRDGADRRREKLLGRRDADGELLYPTREGFDRDEAPAAVLRKRVDADVEYVRSSENRAAGASLGGQISGYCDGTKVKYRFTG